MERGDIAISSGVGQASIFEGVIASPPSGVSLVKEKFYIRRNDWDAALGLWTPNELPLKSLIDSVERLGISTEVITFLSVDAVDPIYRWLLRKGVTTPVYFYENVEAYAEDLKYNRAIKVVYAPNKDVAYSLGMRATVVNPESAWRL